MRRLVPANVEAECGDVGDAQHTARARGARPRKLARAMLREFFGAPSSRCLAVGGALALVLSAALFQLGNSLVVDWYGRFYDQLQAAAALEGSDALARGRREVLGEMGVFARIAMPLAVLAPLSKFLRAHFVFGWRMALVRAYLRRWDGAAAGAVPEGSSQRVQEDTDRFAKGIELFAGRLLDGVLQLVIFVPRLLDFGAQFDPPGVGPAAAPRSWLLLLALGLACSQKRLPGGPWLEALRAIFEPSWALRNLSNGGAPVCIYPGLAAYLLSEPSVDALVPFFERTIFRGGWDGLYLDQMFLDGQLLDGAQWHNIDCDGDGRPDSREACSAQYVTWRAAFTSRLRKAAGAKLLFANTFGNLVDASLNGVCIEMETCGPGAAKFDACARTYAKQLRVGAKPPMNEIALTHLENVNASAQCEVAHRLSDMGLIQHAGFDPFDGSVVHCAR